MTTPNTQKRKLNSSVICSSPLGIKWQSQDSNQSLQSWVYWSPWSWDSHGLWLFVPLVLTTPFPGAWIQLRFVFSQWRMSSYHSESTYRARHCAKNFTQLVPQSPKIIQLVWGPGAWSWAVGSRIMSWAITLLGRGLPGLHWANVKWIQHCTNQRELLNGSGFTRIDHVPLETTVTWDGGRILLVNPLTPSYRAFHELCPGKNNPNWSSVFLFAKWE